jgi:hypothetical protein
MRVRLLLGLALLPALGCGGAKVASVSGQVTLNGKALSGATVSFQPIAPKGSMNAAPGSTGKTDADGKFTLKTATGQEGAYVGEHRVMISRQTADAEDTDRRGRPRQKELVPERYNAKSDLTFTVPPGGTTGADFALKSP